MARRSAPSSGGGLLRTAERLGVNRGLLGGSKGWLYVGTGLWTLRKVRKLAARRTEVLVSEPLRPGDRLMIANGRLTTGDGGAARQLQVQGGRRARRARRKAG